MIPVLYPKNEKTFRTFGLGQIFDAYKIEVERERNGNYKLYIKYPLDGVYANVFEKEMLIKSDAGVRTEWQTFEIERIKRDSKESIEIFARHISERTGYIQLKPKVTDTGLSAQEALRLWAENIIGDDEFEVWSDIESTSDIAWEIGKVNNAREALGGVTGSILDIYGGEYEFDNNLIKLHKQMGRKAPTVLEYGRNITSVIDEDNLEGVYTSIYPYAKYTPENQNQNAKQKEIVVTLPEFIIDGKYVSNYPKRRILQVDFSSEFNEDVETSNSQNKRKNIPTAKKLRELAEKYVRDNEIGKPKIDIEIEYVDLAQTLDYQDFEIMEEVELCDIIPVYYPDFGIYSSSEKVVAITYDVYAEQNLKINLGTIGTPDIRSELTKGISERVNTIEAKQTALELDIPKFMTNLQGNRIWREKPDENMEHKIGDIWFEKNGQYDRMYVWNGNMWELVMDSEDIGNIIKRIEDEFGKVNKSLEDQESEYNRQVEEILSKSTTAEELAAEGKRLAEEAKADAATSSNEALNALREAQSAGRNASQAKADLQVVENSIKQLVTKTDFNAATGRLTNAETAITTQAGEIAKRLTSTQVEQAITGKGYQTKAQVDSNITGRGYITNSALQPYVTSTVLENKVRETADSFERKLTSTKRDILSGTVTITAFNEAKTTLDAHKRLIGDGTSLSKAIQSADKFERSIANGGELFQAIETARGLVTTVENLSVGSRNYVLNSNECTTDKQKYYTLSTTDFSIFKGKTLIISADAETINASGKYGNHSRTGIEAAIRFTDGTTAWDLQAFAPSNNFKGRVVNRYTLPNKDIRSIDIYALNQWASGTSRICRPMLEISSIPSDYKPAPEDTGSALEAVKTQVSQLSGSWAVKNLTSAGTILNQMNLNKDGTVRIDGSLVQITGKTLIEKGVIKSAMIGNAQIESAHIKSVDVNSIKGLDATFLKAQIGEAVVGWLSTKTIVAENNAMKINLNKANITFEKEATIDFNSANNALVRKKGTHTAFVHFNDVAGSSDKNAGSLYASIGVTSSGDGINSSSSGRFAGLRIFRGAIGTAQNATVDKIELYADKFQFEHAFDSYSNGLTITPDRFFQHELADMFVAIDRNFKQLEKTLTSRNIPARFISIDPAKPLA